MLPPILALLAGLLLGRFVLPNSVTGQLDPVVMLALGIIVCCAGISIGAKNNLLSRLRAYKAKILLFPLAICFGSVIGGMVAGLLLDIPAGQSGAIGAGMAYYSLSSGILTKLCGVELGALSFLANVLREAFALLFTPVIARRFGYHTAIAPAGATSMDTALGVIARSTDEETVLIAMINGAVLTAIVPILVPLLCRV